MAWFRPMGAAEVAYHQETVVGRGDDHPGRALAYYGSRGETPLRWGGAGATRLGLSGEVTPEAYEASFGPGGFGGPATGAPLVVSKRPGFELVVSAHKSVAMLGVVGDADAMHLILDAETAGTMDWLDGWFQTRGGRRGRAQVRTATGGLTYAMTRHATSRASDPSPHDHVLVANVIEMMDDRGGWKALDSAALRDTVEAATMVGRLHSAWRAVALGFEIAPDDGPSGNLRHWQIVGVPGEVCELFSKRSDEIAEHLAETGQHGYRARGIAARQTRKVKRHTSVDELMTGWHIELHAAGWPVERLAAQLEEARQRAPQLRFGLADADVDRLAADVLDIDGNLLARHKVFTRTNLVAEVAPRLYGHDPAELDRVLERITASRDVVPLIRVAGAREQSYTTVEVLVAEQTIAAAVERLAALPGPLVPTTELAAAVAAKEQTIGRALTTGQRATVEAICVADRAVTVVVGVAGSGKTTALDVASTALEASGYRMVGTSTSGQAARNLALEAGVEARTFTSLLWRLDHGQIGLDDRTVVVIDEAGMADDADVARLVLAIERANAKLVLVGDHRQLAAVGPGGALAALLERRPDLVVALDENVRQRDPAERRALAQLRSGSVAAAVAWYAEAGQITTTPTRIETLVAMADAWAKDVVARHDTALLAWRRDDVADLNRLARDHWDRLGHLQGPDITVSNGRTYAIGDRIVALAPNRTAGLVTSEQLTITAMSNGWIAADTETGRSVLLHGAAIDRQHLDHAYALTVHRAQGSTYDRAHVLVAGGGRELAYVALSRARNRTTIYATADELSQAVNDLQTDWGVEHHQRWVSASSASFGVHPESQRRADGPALTAASMEGARVRIAVLERDYQDIQTGLGRWQHSPEGRAARGLHSARSQLDDALHRSTSPLVPRRERRAAKKNLGDLRTALLDAEREWQAIGAPAADTLTSLITAERRRLRHDTVQQRHAASLLPAFAADIIEYQDMVERLPIVARCRPARDLGIEL